MPRVVYPLDKDGTERRDMPLPQLGPSQDADISFRQVETFCSAVRACIKNNDFMVLQGDPEDPLNSRNKNRDFMFRYGIWTKRDQRSFLLRMEPEDFCHIVHANDGRDLYVFCMSAELYQEAMGRRMVNVYVKHDYVGRRGEPDVVISLHELERPIVQLFRD